MLRKAGLLVRCVRPGKASAAFHGTGVPDDIGPMIAALLSDDNHRVNGQRIEVSGGMSL
jgi:NAD(P)-dependent dehydrogenase (short-subunit alcohol dehydrogenase family)